jgi:putative membrane protein
VDVQYFQATTVRLPVRVNTELNAYQLRCLIVIGVAAVLSFVAAPYPAELRLQHIPTLLYLIAIPFLTRRFRISDFSATCLTVFMLMHIIGARYLYSYVPYDRWTNAVLDFSISEKFDFQRNHYDRLCHFAFGLLWLSPVWEVLVRQLRISHWRAAFLGVLCLMACSAFYEMIEWSITLVLAPADANSFNGQQGDTWDSQKDMFVALLGSLCALGVLLPFVRRKYRREG